jgi:two-component system CheB/CheR fusion protein
VTENAESEPDEKFEAVLTYLKDARGFDFTGYKRTSLRRRIEHRLRQIGLEDYDSYIDYLQVNSDEFAALFNTVLINVTSFFRDGASWEYLRQEVIPMMLAERGPEQPIRVWSAGCASGQEAYSLAILLAEALGTELFRQRVKVYATDVDEEALEQARHATYSARELDGLSEEYLEKYFEQQGAKYAFRKDLRRSVIFGRNDLVQDAPISRVDLLVCRNTLMYFNAETQAKILQRIHFALAPRGLLFIGNAEMLLSRSRLFEPLDLKRRVFRKVAAHVEHFGHLVGNPGNNNRATGPSGADELRAQAFATSPVAQVVIDTEDVVAAVNNQAEAVFGLSRRDVGRLFRDLEVSYRPVELRTYVEQARSERRSVRVDEVEWQRTPGEPVWFEIHVSPLLSAAEELLGISIAFHDVTAARRLLGELENANRELETAYQELQSTNEELETTNEELQSTVEELETTNEELQSTNEELETINEELQSTNDELKTINDTLRQRTVELDEVGEFLEAILTSFHAGIVVIDPEMRVLAWNRGAEDLWGLRRDEVEGQHLLNLDIGLPLAELRPKVRHALSDVEFSEESRLNAVNRKGREIEVRVICSALHGAAGGVTGAILVMEGREPDAG